MSKDNLVSCRFEDYGIKQLDDLVEYYQKDTPFKVDRSTILRIAIDRMYRNVIEPNK